MEMYTTIISPDEQVLLLGLLQEFMIGAKKVNMTKNFNMCVKNENFTLWLTPKRAETLAGLLLKYDIFTEYHQKLIDWILEYKD